MSFQARKLRVQLPCGETTVFEEEADPARAAAQDCIGLTCGAISQCALGTIGCRFPTEICEGGTCWFQSPPNCGFFSPCGAFTCDLGTCARFASPCGYGTCGFVSPCGFGTCRIATPCRFGSCDFFSSCGPRSVVGCQRGSLPIDPGRLVVDPEDLPALREALEAQLKEIEKAEQAIEERRKSES